jgi:hypothetical protein
MTASFSAASARMRCAQSVVLAEVTLLRLGVAKPFHPLVGMLNTVQTLKFVKTSTIRGA